MKDTINKDGIGEISITGPALGEVEGQRTSLELYHENTQLLEENRRLKEEIQELVQKIISIEQEIDIFSKHECSLEINPNGSVMSVNDFMLNLSGYSRDELIGKNVRIMNSGFHSKEFWRNFWETILSGRVWSGDICNKKKDGSDFWLRTLIIPKIDPLGNILSFKVIRQDVSESYFLRKKLDEINNSSRDALTGLPTFQNCIEANLVPKKRSLAILHINNMSNINAVYGRSVGNTILKDIAELLSNYARSNPSIGITVYKFEGSDFGVIFDTPITQKYIERQFEAIRNLTLSHNDSIINLSFSLGVVLSESDISTLTKMGYLALKNSNNKTNQITFTQGDALLKEFEEQFKIQNLIFKGYQEDLFRLSKQEIKDISQSIEKERRYECLVRLYTSSEGSQIILPHIFLPVINEKGDNAKLTRIVTEKACIHMQQNPGFYSINLTADDLYSKDNLEYLHKVILRYGIDPHRITFEILEEIESIDSDIMLKNISILKGYGYRIAIDDFGTGFSNFSRLLDFKPDIIKIHMKYVRGIDNNPRHASLVRVIVMFAHENGIKVNAEGVETESEATALRMLQVDYLQGFLYSRPQIVE